MVRKALEAYVTELTLKINWRGGFAAANSPLLTGSGWFASFSVKPIDEEKLSLK
jgi:hypothetical protein